jgi:hypothetical protein
MKNSILKLGKALSKIEQTQIKGGGPWECLQCYNYCRMTTSDRAELAECQAMCHQNGIC